MESERIRFGDLSREARELRPALEAAFHRVLDRGWYVLGEELAAFEQEFAAWLPRRACVGCASGTDAITLALRALGVGAGDEVITAANTCGPTAVGIRNSGATVVLADADPATLMLDPAAAERAVSPATKAIVPVHLYGGAADLEALGALAERRGLVLVEDCAQSHGSSLHGRRTGTWGDVGAFSFYPSKNLGALGDGGACATGDPDVAERLRQLRNYGQATRYTHDAWGVNSRLDELQAAFLRAKLPHLERGNERRRALAARYREALADCPGLELPRLAPGVVSVHHLFVILHPDRDALQRHLAEQGIDTLVHYPVPLHRQPGFADLGYAPGDFPVAESACARLLSLPLHPWLLDAEVDRVCGAVRRFAEGREPGARRA